MTLKSRLASILPGVPPAPIPPGAPSQISGANLKRLGELRGKAWYSHSELGALCERLEAWREDDRAPAPNAYLIPERVDGYGQRFYRVLDRFPAGTYDALKADAGPAAKPKAEPAMLPIDALDAITMLAPRQSMMVAPPSRTPPVAIIEGDPTNARVSPGYFRDGHGPIRGCEAIEAAYRERKFGFVLDPTGERVYITSPDGRLAVEVRGHAALLSPLLAPWKRTGKPPACVVCRHGGYVEAITVVEPELPWCKRDPALASKERAA